MKALQPILQKAVAKYPYQEVEVEGFMESFMKKVAADPEASESAKEKANFALQRGLFKKDKIEDPTQIRKRKNYIKRLIFEAIEEGKFTKLQANKLKKQYANK